MMKLRINKWWIVLSGICWCSALLAQPFRYSAKLNPVNQTGFYAIPVSPELSAHMQLDFSDVRLWDADNKQVPYIVRGKLPKWQRQLFKAFAILENGLDDSGRSAIVIRKQVDYPIASLSLVLRNASVSRYARLSGSNDGKKWFIVSEGVLINESYETLSDSSIQSITFPLSSYSFFKLTIDNRKSDPLNIVEVGYYPDLQYHAVDKYLANPETQITQRDSSNGISYIQVKQAVAFPVSKLSVSVIGPKFFSRKISLFVPGSYGRKLDQDNLLFSGNISSSGNFETAVPAFKSTTFTIAIENGDNPPLQIKSVAAWQNYHEMVAWLEAGKPYQVVMEAENTAAPHYDLQQFADSIPSVLPQATIQVAGPMQKEAASASYDRFPNKYIWLIMAAAVDILSLLTWRLTAEMRKTDNSQ